VEPDGSPQSHDRYAWAPVGPRQLFWVIGPARSRPPGVSGRNDLLPRRDRGRL